MDIPFSKVDLNEQNPINGLIGTAEQKEASNILSREPNNSRALVSTDFQAMLYALIRNMEPEVVIEIGSFWAATSEVVCGALSANGRGILFTIDPYGADRVPHVIRYWPKDRRAHVLFQAINSMALYEIFANKNYRADIIFVDGNHDYEFALFDLLGASRLLAPGGFILVDNISQCGPYQAVRDFLSQHPDWLECSGTDFVSKTTRAFDKSRCGLQTMDCAILRAPQSVTIGDRPWTSGNVRWTSSTLSGLELDLLEGPSQGKLYAQVVFRGFSGNGSQYEEMIERSIDLNSGNSLKVRIDTPLSLSPSDTYLVEPWLVWHGDSPLRVAGPPKVF